MKPPPPVSSQEYPGARDMNTQRVRVRVRVHLHVCVCVGLLAARDVTTHRTCETGERPAGLFVLFVPPPRGLELARFGRALFCGFGGSW